MRSSWRRLFSWWLTSSNRQLGKLLNWSRRSKKILSSLMRQRIKWRWLWKQASRRTKKLPTKSVSWSRRLRRLKPSKRRVRRKWLRLLCRNSKMSRLSLSRRRMKLISIKKRVSDFFRKLRVWIRNQQLCSKLLMKRWIQNQVLLMVMKRNSKSKLTKYCSLKMIVRLQTKLSRTKQPS